MTFVQRLRRIDSTGDEGPYHLILPRAKNDGRGKLSHFLPFSIETITHNFSKSTLKAVAILEIMDRLILLINYDVKIPVLDG